MNLVTLMIAGGLLAGSVLVGLGLWAWLGAWLGASLRTRTAGASAGLVTAEGDAPGFEAEPAGADTMAAEVAARLGGLLAEQSRAQADALADLKAEILGLKSDVEWLAGERMIEQAIAMARSGVEAGEIGRELGLSADAAETIVALRRH